MHFKNEQGLPTPLLRPPFELYPRFKLTTRRHRQTFPWFGHSSVEWCVCHVHYLVELDGVQSMLLKLGLV